MDETIKLRELFYGLRKRWKIILTVTLLTVLAFMCFNIFLKKNMYESTTKVFIGKEAKGDQITYDNNDILMYQKLMKTYSELIKTDDIIAEALTGIEPIERYGEIKSNLTVTPSPDTQIMIIKYQDTDKNKALIINKAITDNFILKSKDLIPNGNVQVIENPKLPKNPIGFSYIENLLMALATGIALGLLLAIIVELLANNFKTSDELEAVTDIPVIGVIPSDKAV